MQCVMGLVEMCYTVSFFERFQEYFDRVEATLQRTPLQATAVLRKKYEYLLKATKTALKRPWWDLQSYMYMAFGSSASAVTSAAGYPLLDVTMTGVRARFLSPPPIRIKQGIRSGNPDRERREEVEMQKVELPGIRVRRSRPTHGAAHELETLTTFLGTIGVSSPEPAHLSTSLSKAVAPLAESRIAPGVLQQRLHDRAQKNAALLADIAKLEA
uniref:Uncharacterized protein n=1 Tax=Haptolina ericina TaxID=156174 RepID=A0A7S3AHK9_9EUKA